MYNKSNKLIIYQFLFLVELLYLGNHVLDILIDLQKVGIEDALMRLDRREVIEHTNQTWRKCVMMTESSMGGRHLKKRLYRLSCISL